ncbi:MAG TPA: hypothetical protein VND92_02540 [Vicinamibacterales bacterium]|nr:hypothetical protein [Vicinamibacterales bacterium]
MDMRRVLGLTASFGLLAALALPATATAEVTTVKGEVITIMCYEGHGQKGTGQAHRACAVSCAKKGYPLAILATDGTYYRIAGPLTAHDNVQLQKYLASKVEVKGDVVEQKGAKTITIPALSDIVVQR